MRSTRGADPQRERYGSTLCDLVLQGERIAWFPASEAERRRLPVERFGLCLLACYEDVDGRIESDRV
jgi:hypothetical protein